MKSALDYEIETLEQMLKDEQRYLLHNVHRWNEIKNKNVPLDMVKRYRSERNEMISHIALLKFQLDEALEKRALQQKRP